MKVLVPLFAILALAYGTYVERHFAQKTVDYINSIGTTWKAGVNKKFEGMPKSTIRRMMGVIMDEEKRLIKNLPVHTNEDIVGDIPEEFDARTKWPMCKDVIAHIRDQSACGSCWAVGAAGAMSDRICIASGGKTTISLAARDLMSCCHTCGFGCEGGYPHAAWSFFKSTGLVTGSSYADQKGCEPYPFPECEHHNNHTTYKPCPSKLYKTPACAHQCTNKDYTVAFKDDKHHSKSAYSVSSQVAAIQKEIMTYGSVEVAYTVYEDFLSYTSGVYQHKSGSYEGGHAVRAIGWGVEDGTPYWLIANSWNSDWGDKGYFKILRGKDECGIESGVVAGQI